MMSAYSSSEIHLPTLSIFDQRCVTPNGNILTVITIMYHGTIKDIEIKWNEKAKEGIFDNPDHVNVSLETIKAVTENFLYWWAVRLKRTQVIIMFVTYETHLLVAKKSH